MATEVGRIVGGRWEIERLLARGGMGAVWVARHRITRETVALKLLFPDEPREDELHERMLREAAAPAQIGHPGLVRVLDAGVDGEDGSMYLAMELLEGESVRDRLARPGVTRAAALQLVVSLLEPLAAAHALGFVHRDLKPQNAFVARQPDGSERVKLLDFGLARRPGVRTVTDAGNVMGTAAYTSPEQLRSPRNVGPAADVWSVGVTLYQILAGRLPFEGVAAEVFPKILSEAAPPLGPDVAPALAALVERCLAKDPADRPPDAGALHRDLIAALGGPSVVPLVVPSPRPPPPPPPPSSSLPSPSSPPLLAAPAEVVLTTDSAVTQRRGQKPPSLRRRAVVVAASAFVGSVLVLGIGSLLREPPPRPAPIVSLRERPVTLSLPPRSPELASPRPSPVILTPPPPPPAPDPLPPSREARAPEVPRPRAPREPLAPRAQPQQQHHDEQQQQQQQQVAPTIPTRPNGRNARDCGRITNASAARCFVDATGDSAAGEYMLRNLILAHTLLGTRNRARALASRYFADFGTSPFAQQVRQLGYNP